MAQRLASWFKYDRPEAVRGREAANYHRILDSQLWRTSGGQQGTERFDDAIARRLEEDARNPLAEALRTTLRGSERMSRLAEEEAMGAERGIPTPQELPVESALQQRYNNQRGQIEQDLGRPLRPHETATLEGDLRRQLITERTSRVTDPLTGGPQAALLFASGIGRNLDRPGAALRGALEAGVEHGALSPEQLRAAGRGFQEPQEYSPEAIAGRHGLTDQDVPGFFGGDIPGFGSGARFRPDNLSLRDIASAGVGVLTDPTDLAFGGSMGGLDAAAAVARGTRRTGRALKGSLRGALDDAIGEGGAIHNALRPSTVVEAAGRKKPPAEGPDEALKLPDIRDVPTENIDTMPEAFQARNVTEGASYDEGRVKNIVDNFDPAQYDPLVLAKKPGTEGRYVVIAGHHREEAAKRLGLPRVPARILEGDITDPAVRRQMVITAANSNFKTATPDLMETFRSFTMLRDNDLSLDEIAATTRKKPSQVQAVFDIGAMGESIVEQVTRNSQLDTLAATIGSSVRRYGVDPETAAGMFRALVKNAGEGGKLPTATAAEDMVKAYGAKLASKSIGQGEMLAGFEDSAIMRAMAEEAQLRSQLNSEATALQRRISSARRLGSDVGDEDLGERLAQLAQPKLDELRSRIAQIREEVIGRFEGMADAPAAAANDTLSVLDEAEALGVRVTPETRRAVLAGDEEFIANLEARVAAARTPQASVADEAVDVADERASQRRARLRRAARPSTERAPAGPPPPRQQAPAPSSVASRTSEEVSPVAPRSPVDDFADEDFDFLESAPPPASRAPEAPVGNPPPRRESGANDLLAQIRRGENVPEARADLAARFGMSETEIDNRLAFPDQEGPGLFDAPAAPEPPPAETFTPTPRSEAIRGVASGGPRLQRGRAVPPRGTAILLEDGSSYRAGIDDPPASAPPHSNFPKELYATTDTPARQVAAPPPPDGGTQPSFGLDVPSTPSSQPQRAAAAANQPRPQPRASTPDLTRGPRVPVWEGLRDAHGGPPPPWMGDSLPQPLEGALFELPSGRRPGSFETAPPPSRQYPTPIARPPQPPQRATFAPDDPFGRGSDVPLTRLESASGGGGSRPPAPPIEPPAGGLPSGRQPGPSGREFPVEEPKASPLLPRAYRGERNVDAVAKAQGIVNPVNHTRAGDDPLRAAEDYFGQQGQVVPDGVRDALEYAKSMMQPGQGRGHAVRAAITPGRKLAARVWRAFVAQGNTEADILTRLAPWEMQLVESGKRLFGGLDDVKVRYIGPATRKQAFLNAAGEVEVREVPAAQWLTNAKGRSTTGTMKDVVENPTFYDLSDEQRQWIRRFNADNLAVNGDLRRDYGLDVGDFLPPELADNPELTEWVRGNRRADAEAGAFGFVPNVNADEDVLVALGGGFDPKPGGGGRLQERSYATGAQRAEFDPHFKPVTDLEHLFSGMNRAKARGAGRVVWKAGVGGSLVEDRALTRSAIGTFLPAHEGRQVAELERLFDPKSASGRVISAFNSMNQAALSGDLSPLTIQGLMGFLASPIETARIVAGGVRRSLDEGDLLRPFRASALADDVAQDPEWLDFAQARGITAVSTTPDEFAGGWLRHLPGYSKFNESAYIAITRQQKGLWSRMRRDLMATGLSPDEASELANTIATQIIPTFNPRRAGLSQQRAVIERFPVTSISFLRQPAAFMETAGRGMLKLGTRQQTTMEERLAAKLFVQMAGSAAAISVSTAAADAAMRGEDVEQRIRDVLNPTKSTFLNAYAPGTGWRAGIGGPFRAGFRAIWPQDVTLPGGYKAYIPFAGVPDAARGRVQIFGGRVVDVVRNRNYFDEPILKTGEFPLNVWQGLTYIAAGALPLSVDEPLEALRRGDDAQTAAARTAGAVVGLNAVPPTLSNQRNRLRDEIARAAGHPSWAAMNEQEADRALAALPDSAAKLDALDERIQQAFDPEGAKERDAATAERLAGEAELVRRLKSTTDPIPLTQFQEQMEMVQAKAAWRIRATMEGKDFPAAKEPGPRALQLYRETYELARMPGDTLDFDKLESLQSDLYRALTPEQIKYIEGRREAKHHPDVQWYFDNKKTIRDAGYWDVSSTVYDRIRVQLQEKGVDMQLPPSYRDAVRAEMIAKNSGDTLGAGDLGILLGAVSKVTEKERVALRLADPGLEKALQENRGYKPVEGGLESALAGITDTSSKGKFKLPSLGGDKPKRPVYKRSR